MRLLINVLSRSKWSCYSPFLLNNYSTSTIIGDSTKRKEPEAQESTDVNIGGDTYKRDKFTNITHKILSCVGRNLHCQHNHPLNLIQRRIQKFFHSNYMRNFNSPLFTVINNLSPVVSVEDNFDSVLVPTDHISRKLSDTYYINENYVLRTHTSAHQCQLLKAGLDACLVVGDVYRRDAIDQSHYPVFHQMEGIKLMAQDEVFKNILNKTNLNLFDPSGSRTTVKQQTHTLEASKLVEVDLKRTLTALAQHMFGDVESRWVEAYFPFTHPSWELEIKFKGEWFEVLGCGIMEQQLLNNCGVGYKIGWAFGLGLDRLAMLLYGIDDIRLFWSKDTGFLSQFDIDDENTPITYKPIAIYPQCYLDMSFWIPDDFEISDFTDLVRSIGGDIVEQVKLIDEFRHPETNKLSNCFSIVYRHMEKTLTKEEVNKIHKEIAEVAEQKLNVRVR